MTLRAVACLPCDPASAIVGRDPHPAFGNHFTRSCPITAYHVAAARPKRRVCILDCNALYALENMGIPDILSSAPRSSQVEPAKPLPSYRDVKQLPAQLLDHCTVCLEEQLFSQAIPLLSSAVTAGNGTIRPAYVPPVQHLSLLATLIVHPSTTTRTTSEEKHQAADDALQYLRHLNTITSADQSGLNKALQFRDSASSRSKRARTRHSDLSSDDESEDPGRIRSTYADQESLFANAEDFWAVVGWAFNCSVAHSHRWSRWQLWLRLMLDVLEDDLESRYYTIRDSGSTDNQLLKDSLLAQYLASFVDSGRNTKRRIMRAILADGKQTSLNQFPEIWRNETRPPKAKPEPKTGSKRTLDLDQGDFGDYFDSDSDAEATTPTATTPRPSRRPSTRPPSNKPSRQPSPSTPQTPSTPQSTHGPPNSLTLRLRLLTLLTRLSTLAPTLFLDPEDLFDLYTEFLRPLPLPVFSSFLLHPPNTTTTSNPAFDAPSLASLTQMLLRPLLSSAAPVYNANALTPADFAAHFAPFAAGSGSAGENARVGVCVEVLLRLLWGEGAFEGLEGEEKEEVRRAVGEGIRAREEKVGSGEGRRRKGEEGAWEVLRAGGERMGWVLGEI